MRCATGLADLQRLACCHCNAALAGFLGSGRPGQGERHFRYSVTALRLPVAHHHVPGARGLTAGHGIQCQASLLAIMRGLGPCRPCTIPRQFGTRRPASECTATQWDMVNALQLPHRIRRREAAACTSLVPAKPVHAEPGQTVAGACPFPQVLAAAPTIDYAGPKCGTRIRLSPCRPPLSAFPDSPAVVVPRRRTAPSMPNEPM